MSKCNVVLFFTSSWRCPACMYSPPLNVESKTNNLLIRKQCLKYEPCVDWTQGTTVSALVVVARSSNEHNHIVNHCIFSFVICETIKANCVWSNPPINTNSTTATFGLFFGTHGRWGWGSEESGSNRHVLYNHFSILVAALTPWDVLRSNATSKVSEHFVLYSMVWTTFLSRGRADWVIWQLPFYIDLCILPLWLAALNFRSDGAYPQHSFLFRKRWGL